MIQGDICFLEDTARAEGIARKQSLVNADSIESGITEKGLTGEH